MIAHSWLNLRFYSDFKSIANTKKPAITRLKFKYKYLKLCTKHTRDCFVNVSLNQKRNVIWISNSFQMLFRPKTISSFGFKISAVTRFFLLFLEMFEFLWLTSQIRATRILEPDQIFHSISTKYVG